MISREHRTVFVHIPKTGGQSVETVFLRTLGLSWAQRARLLLRANENPKGAPARLAHLYAAEYVPLGYLTQDDFDAFFKFAVVRNPWARVVSNYKYIFQNNPPSFELFVELVIVQEGNISDTRQVEPQVNYVCDARGKIIVDRIIRFENMAAEFAEVSLQIFGREEPLPSVNVSSDRRDYRSFYTPATRKIVAQKYRDDIETFGYEFG